MSILSELPSTTSDGDAMAMFISRIVSQMEPTLKTIIQVVGSDAIFVTLIFASHVFKHHLQYTTRH
jgi:hypothetical protein